MGVNAGVTASNLRVLVADEDRRALDDLGRTLTDLGHEVTPYAVSVAEASHLIAAEEPDLAFVMAHRDDDHALALIGEAVEFASGPVIAHIRGGGGDFIARAARRGVSAGVHTPAPRGGRGAGRGARPPP